MRMCCGRQVAAAVVFMAMAATGARAALVPSRNASTYVILARRAIKMKDFAFTNLGNVGVSEAAGTIAWGKKSFFADGSEVTADVLMRAGKSSSLWDVFANTVVSPLPQAGAVVRDQGPLAWSPLSLISPLAPDPSCTPGGTGVNVLKGESLTLASGAYGAVVVQNGGTLELTGGTYCFSDVKIGRKSLVVVDAAVDVTVMGRVRALPGAVLKPASNSGLGATDIAVGVAGKQVKFSGKTRISGVFYAPNALLRFGRGGFYTGQFIADQIRSDFGDTFTLEACGNGVVDPGEQCDAGSANGQPGSCCTSACDFEAAGTSCADGNQCNGGETCSAFGQCVPGTPLDCNNHNVCTIDTCVPATGCVHTNVPDDTPCPDSTVCDGAETCKTGVCKPGTALDCNDHKGCTTDSCDPVNGCQNRPITVPGGECPCPNGDSDCDNHNKCDGVETCDDAGEICRPGTPPTCGTTNPCLIPGCDPQIGCTAASAPTGTPCNDGDACSINDQCAGSACGGFDLGCDDGDPCTTDACDVQSGCSNTPIGNCGDQTGDTFCTLTQGAYGAPNGIANGPQGWVTNHLGILPASIGAPGTGLSVTIANQGGLTAFMPTGGPANVLCGNALPVPCPGDLVVAGAGDVPDPSGVGSGGDGAGVLAGQTLAMTLSVALSNAGANPTGLGTHQLAPSICTCDGNGGKAGPYVISQCVLDNAGTVDDLLGLANQALRGIPLATIDACLTYSGISSALDALNNGFDECRSACSCN